MRAGLEYCTCDLQTSIERAIVALRNHADSIYIVGEGIDDQGVKMLSTSLAGSDTLTSLNLSCNRHVFRQRVIDQNKRPNTFRITNEGGKTFGVLLQSGKPLRHLDISNNDMDEDGAEFTKLIP